MTAAHIESVEGSPMTTLLLRFVHRLRDAAIPVSMVEAIDAVESVRHLDLSNRGDLRAALGATLVKNAEDRGVFDSLFDIYFPMQREQIEMTTSLDRAGVSEEGAETGAEDGPPSSDLLEGLLEALRSGDASRLRAMASLAVSMFAGIGGDRDASERYYLFRVLRQLELSEILRQAVLQTRADGESASGLDERLSREGLEERIEEFRKMLAEELRWQLSQVRGADVAAEAFHDVPIEDVDFVTASPTELRQMREAIRPLAAKLAARVARRRRLLRHGRLDVRRTMRRSLAAGGVPLDPAFRFRRASKPDLYLLCDISGSMAEFARFTMSLLYAMKGEFSRIRQFVFVDGIDEVTDRFHEGSDWLAPRNLLYGTDVVAADGHSDYGNVFERFWHLYGYADLDPRSTMIITGDARNNYREAGAERLRAIKERARRLYWLNPEPRERWDTSDSIMAAYEAECTEAYEVRNLAQLTDFVLAIA